MEKLSNEKHFFSFSPSNTPAMKVKSGSVVEIETMDCFSNQITNSSDTIEKLDWAKINPATGPIFVEGAKEGDALKVDILDISVAPQGVMLAGENEGTLGHLLKGIQIKIIPIKEDKAIFDSKLSIPLNKMVGVIGVAPEKEEIPCGTPGSHGGNMDNLMITKGSTLYLPVFVEGALFGLGDLHAAMGDGEIGVTGVEVSGKVRVRLQVQRGLKIQDPLLLNDEHFTTIASAQTTDEALKKATENMALILKGRLPINLHEIVMLMSAVGQAQICQMVDPLRTARFVMPQWVLKKYDFNL
ncbi:acetamidase/formamidase family protein [Mesoaciditoga lauensis]|uniref:acetamidase/formamidase family protein n=1 Tax=Mesoaciditoga lauensis TaxID=1495039 RepID=UPI000561AF66|nr:acetamidase/formamidase family protein [Mesoaciditoga lauensis]